MGKIKHLKEVMGFFEKTPVAGSRDVAMIVGDSYYANLLLHNLAKRGGIKRIVKGYYTAHEEPSLAVFCFRPAYLGLQEALSIHGLWEQETNTVIVTVRSIRPGIRNILESNVVLHRLDKRYLFGFDLVKYGDFYLPVSDIEKTLIDLVYFNELPDKKVLQKFRTQINAKKLKAYLKKYPPAFRKRVLKLVQRQ